MKKDKNKKRGVIAVHSDADEDDDGESYEEKPRPKKSKDRKTFAVACKNIYTYIVWRTPSIFTLLVPICIT